MDYTANKTDFENLDQQVKSMMKHSDNANLKKVARVCKVCGKEGRMTYIKNHIEANHTCGISLPCGLCGKLLTLINTTNNHKSNYHRNEFFY